MSEEFYARLTAATDPPEPPPIVPKFADAERRLRSWVRCQIRLPYTRQPVIGFMRRIMPMQCLHPLEHWQRLGLADPEDPGEPTEWKGETLYSHRYDHGMPFYEVAEELLYFEHMEALCQVRRISHRQWDTYQRRLRYFHRRRHPRCRLTAAEHTAWAYRQMGELVSLLPSGR